ncbi:E3 ubiquitin-protein ligase TRIM22-like [Dreissena polymorpha]|uniref:E3 ubiquitin-protein ligase TRIM22-like n=1 Tax=Dreissena polymorpha TaxID=45954 RepID=UPI0022647FBC|nr:E3 ubiquitin-protein ligase TRIM22-like [Dreissena polymorpha]
MLDDILELCEEHRTEKLTMFCEDHEKLLCHVCHLRNHRQCSQVVLLADKVKSAKQRMNVTQMTKTMEQLQKSLQDIVDREKQNKKYLKASYDLVLKEILDFRRQINVNLDLLQQNTLRELETKHASANASLEDHLQKCLQFISKLKGFGTKLKGNLPPERSFITFRKCLDHTAAADSLLNSMINNNGAYMKLLPNSELLQCLADCTDLGKITSRIGEQKHDFHPNKIVSIHDKSQYNVRTATDSRNCSITGICETSNGELVISDFHNCSVKLLNQAYEVIDQVKLPTHPCSMCNISSVEIAVTVCNNKTYTLNGIHFFQADNENITQIKVFKINHICYGIAYHDAELFVTSGTALYQYTMDGRLFKKLYDTSKDGTVVGVGVSLDGKRIYVTDVINGKLLTLTRDGLWWQNNKSGRRGRQEHSQNHNT